MQVLHLLACVLQMCRDRIDNGFEIAVITSFDIA